jgi:hypothetical protein
VQSLGHLALVFSKNKVLGKTWSLSQDRSALSEAYSISVVYHCIRVLSFANWNISANSFLLELQTSVEVVEVGLREVKNKVPRCALPTAP